MRTIKFEKRQHKTDIHYSRDGDDRVGLWFQPAFIEGVNPEKKEHTSLENALNDLFRRNREMAILLWCGIPLAWSYNEDIPALIEPLLEGLETLQNVEQEKSFRLKLDSRGFRATWNLQARNGQLTIDAKWYQVRGNYHDVLNCFGPLSYSVQEFLYEWKLLLEQCLVAIREAGIVFTTSFARDQINRLSMVESSINDRGRFYKY